MRHAVLREGLPRETAVFAGDDSADTLHVVAEDSGALVGCATLVASAWQGEPAWQLRGMAVLPSHRRTGVGGLMLKQLLRLARDAAGDVRRMWCNARTPAVGFYERHGWVVASDEFVIETAGPHFKMTLKL